MDLPERPSRIPPKWLLKHKEARFKFADSSDGTPQFRLYLRDDFEKTNETWVGIECSCCGSLHKVGGGRCLDSFENFYRHLNGTRHKKKWVKFCKQPSPGVVESMGGKKTEQHTKKNHADAVDNYHSAHHSHYYCMHELNHRHDNKYIHKNAWHNIFLLSKKVAILRL